MVTKPIILIIEPLLFINVTLRRIILMLINDTRWLLRVKFILINSNVTLRSIVLTLRNVNMMPRRLLVWGYPMLVRGNLPINFVNDCV